MNTSNPILKWPEPGTCPTIALADIPVGTIIHGLAPIGIRWTAKKTKKGLKPKGNCPAWEFAPCFAVVRNTVHEVRPNEPKSPMQPR